MAKEKNSKKSLIAFTGGGTGGHVYPVIAVYEELREKLPNADFIYFGAKEKIEKKVAEENQINFQEIPLTGGMPRSVMVVIWAVKFIFSFVATFFLVLKHKPKVIFGTGGYIAAPVFLSAIILRIPYVIHNLDAHLGLANKLFIKDAKALTIGIPLIDFDEKLIPQNGPVVITGNPVRKSFYKSQTNKNSIYEKLGFDPKRKTIIVVGGSQGAQFINEVFLSIINDLLAEKWQVIHQLGPLQYERFSNLFQNNQFYKPEKYINNLNEIYSIVDVAISRSGAMSVAELFAKQIPTIFIPLPSAAQNHQMHNAKSTEDAGCSIVLEQKNVSKRSLKEKIDFIYERRELFKLNIENSNKNKSASNAIAEVISQIIS